MLLQFVMKGPSSNMNNTWAEVTKPITDRWDLCAKLDLDFGEKPEGCKALSKLVKEMARIIDEEIVRRNKPE